MLTPDHQKGCKLEAAPKHQFHPWKRSSAALQPLKVLSLETQMVGFIIKNVGANAPQKRRARRALKGRVVRNGDNLGHHQHAQAKFKSGKLAHAPEDPIDPVLVKQLHAFALQKVRQVTAMPLFLFDEQLQRSYEIWVEHRQARCATASHQPCTVRTFTQLKLLDRPTHQSPLTVGEAPRMRPRQQLTIRRS